MKTLFFTFSIILSVFTASANEAQKVCLFKYECWVELQKVENSELVSAIESINKKSLQMINSEEAEGNVWFKVYKREAKYNTRNLRPTRLGEKEVRTLLNTGMKFFTGSDYAAMLDRYNMGSDFFDDIITFYQNIKYFKNDNLTEQVDFEAYYYDYSQEDDGSKVTFVKDELKVVSNFVETQARADEHDSLVTIDFTNALYNENYEYRPYLMVTSEYVIAALYRWQL